MGVQIACAFFSSLKNHLEILASERQTGTKKFRKKRLKISFDKFSSCVFSQFSELEALPAKKIFQQFGNCPPRRFYSQET